MKVIIGTYRGPRYVHRALDSLTQNLSGWTETVIVDDSGNARWVEAYRGLSIGHMGTSMQVENPKVIALDRQGYNAAMKAVVAEAAGHPFMFWEEDFVLLYPTDLYAMAGLLMRNPDLAQLALLRGPHFQIEKETGGVLPGLIARLGEEFVDLRAHGTGKIIAYGGGNFRAEVNTAEDLTHYSQRGTFTCNPAVWAKGIAEKGWPDGKWSEDAQRDRLLAEGYRFGFLPGVRVLHDGERRGHGY